MDYRCQSFSCKFAAFSPISTVCGLGNSVGGSASSLIFFDCQINLFTIHIPETVSRTVQLSLCNFAAVTIALLLSMNNWKPFSTFPVQTFGKSMETVPFTEATASVIEGAMVSAVS
jgi:hypothetical protein